MNRDTTTYEIRLRSGLDAAWSDWFAGLEVHPRRDGTTALIGTLDQAALHAVLRRIRDLGLSLISVRDLRGGGPSPDAIRTSPEDRP